MFNFWNGNKSNKRQHYELELLHNLLNWNSNEPVTIHCDNTDFPRAQDEGNIFNNEYDVLVTVAGNKKFANQPVIKLNSPICKGLLGHRILIIREQDQLLFNNISSSKLKSLTAGIPATWADAELFRSNGYRVLEQGTLSDTLKLLSDKKCDYVSLGANEVESIFQEHTKYLQGLVIEKSISLYYPLPLVLYVHPEKMQLAQLLDEKLHDYILSGRFEALFNQHFGDVVSSIKLRNRKTINLSNTNLPTELRAFQSQFTS
ncbi:ABC transporter substrate-binding protein [Vibrio sp. 99-70-13A1]|uniref:ABC transporter substrate-binding protein n=1 Tax=Vibrio sp. 99-70-13A1 TaxID=2607601 RepID=UPI0014933B67|nr:ABC transporter substrate-binding protein [Vibrio sp. 99-70-13A1]NOH98142.1 amino acid ABC transporter substrate-binding protein [Vibrio sp. 99-70-13A1]